MRTTSRLSGNPKAGTQAVTIPASLAQGLPPSAVWEIEVTATGYALTFIAAREINSGHHQDPVHLPFVANTEGGR